MAEVGPDASPGPKVSNIPEECWRIVEGIHRGAILCLEVLRGPKVDEFTREDIGGLIVRRNADVIWQSDFDSVVEDSAAGSTYSSHRLDGVEQAVMRHCNACDVPGFTELRAMAGSGFWARLAPIETKPSLTLKVGLLMTQGNVGGLVDLSAKTLDVEVVSQCGEPPFPPAEKSVLVDGEAKRKWLVKAQRWWRPACATSQAPGCRWSNPIETSGQVYCAKGCCSISRADRHNTPFLSEVCFEDKWVRSIEIGDGC